MDKLFVICLLVLVPTLAFAKNQIITLEDGSQIKGELVGIDKGTYTIHTPLLGDVHINSTQVHSISNASTDPAQNASAPQPPTDMSQKVEAMQGKLMDNPMLMADVQQMAQDPEIMNLLADPALLQAITSKDADALKNNPRGQALMNNPKMRAFAEKLQQQDK